MNIGNRIRAVILVAVVVVGGMVILTSNSFAEENAAPTPQKTAPKIMHSEPISLEGGLNKVYAAAIYAAVLSDNAAKVEAARAKEAARIAAQKIVPPSPQVNSGVGDNCGVADIIRANWGGDDEWAIRIAMRESRCTVGVYNDVPCSPQGDYAVGLMQLCMPMHADLYDCNWRTADAACEIRAAWKLFQGVGPGPWRL